MRGPIAWDPTGTPVLDIERPREAHDFPGSFILIHGSLSYVASRLAVLRDLRDLRGEIPEAFRAATRRRLGDEILVPSDQLASYGTRTGSVCAATAPTRDRTAGIVVEISSLRLVIAARRSDVTRSRMRALASVGGPDDDCSAPSRSNTRPIGVP